MKWQLEGRPVLPDERDLFETRFRSRCIGRWHIAGESSRCECRKFGIESRGHVDTIFMHTSGIMLAYGVVGDEFCVKAERETG